LDRLHQARAEFRLERAWEVIDSELESSDKWLRHQAAGLIIAADRAAKDKGAQTINVVLSPEMVFDDQNLQDDGYSDADSPDSD
jgi:hypothetical protein